MARDALLVYSCSGSSNVAQLANHVAVRLDRLGIAEMSCIAGVGGNVPALVRKATGGRPIAILDGCQLTCCEQALSNHGVKPAVTVRLHELGLRKRQHVDFGPDEQEAVFRRVLEELAPALLAHDPAVESLLDAELGAALPE